MSRRPVVLTEPAGSKSLTICVAVLANDPRRRVHAALPAAVAFPSRRRAIARAVLAIETTKQRNAEIPRNDSWRAEKACITQQQYAVNDRHCRTEATEVPRPLLNFRWKHRSVLKSHVRARLTAFFFHSAASVPPHMECSREGSNRTGDCGRRRSFSSVMRL
jgi:hypothetical protein